jgi:uncharacterized protein (TIGR00255 family)
MIHSMTGYGEAHHTEQGLSYSLEIRSLNNRYFKAVTKFPDPLQFLEAQVDKLLRTRLSRGTITYNLRLRSSTSETAYEINAAALQWYLDQLAQAQPPMRPVSIDMATILMLPGVCQPREVDEQTKLRQGQVVEQLTNQALQQLLAMRQEEGSALREDLVANCQAIRQHLDAVAQRAPLVLQEYHQRLHRRVQELTAAAQLQIDQADLTREVALFAERCDIGEELSRRVVEVKSCIDRLKEQVQNVE